MWPPAWPPICMTASHSPAAESRMLEAPVVSAEFFRVLGAHPLLGRDFLPADERPGAHVAHSELRAVAVYVRRRAGHRGPRDHARWQEPRGRRGHAHERDERRV